MSLSSLIQALRSEFYVARYTLGARLLILLLSMVTSYCVKNLRYRNCRRTA